MSDLYVDYLFFLFVEDYFVLVFLFEVLCFDVEVIVVQCEVMDDILEVLV